MSVTPYSSDGSVLPDDSSLMIMPVAFVPFYGLAWVGAGSAGAMLTRAELDAASRPTARL